MNNLQRLHECGTAVWLDFLARDFLAKGGLRRLIEQDSLTGVTSNPSIFEKAIGETAEYAGQLREVVSAADTSVIDVYETLAIRDIRQAADELRPVFDRTGGADGYVSLEVSPYLALDRRATIEEAERLWRVVERPNLMIKVPATPPCIPAIEHLLAEGINVNVTLLFSQHVYEQVVEAYLSGLERLAASGGSVGEVASVASFFVSRIDTAVDKRLEPAIEHAKAPERKRLEALLGKTAIANAKLAYQRFERLFDGPRWERLKAKGARVQRLLWASTGTKNPAYSDVLYVDELIGPHTVNTMPLKTMDAFRDHGQPRPTLKEGLNEAHATLAALNDAGISLDEVTAELVTEGVRLFSDAFDELLAAMAGKRAEILGAKLDGQSLALGERLAGQVKEAAEEWRRDGKIRRLWRGDASLWSGSDETRWLGWLDVVDASIAELPALKAFAMEVEKAGFRDAALLGMGGSSLGPEVIGQTFGSRPGFPKLHVLDSTDPQQVRAVEAKLDLAQTLFIVSSKSGSTLEPNVFKDYFFARGCDTCGKEAAGDAFVAITDPGSSLQKVAEDENFRHIFYGDPAIGGRYSVLSHFGMVPAAAIGLDVEAFLRNARRMAVSCGEDVPPAENPGVLLGLAMGLAARQGRDKVTIIAAPEIADFGAWAEQLIAESTGKNGKGMIPIDGEPLGPPEVYGTDRLFIHLRLPQSGGRDDAALEALEKAGHPVVRIDVRDVMHLGQEFFRFEIAVAVAGAVIGINPFDQPDVEASKVATRALTKAYEESGTLLAEKPVFRGNDIALYTDEKNADALREAGADSSLDSWLRAHFKRAKAGDYAALLAYVERNEAHIAALQEIRRAIRDRLHVATCAEFGPRFLHSTGQAYKGGPNTGVFLQITADDVHDLPVPGHKATFGIIKAAQARGDFQVLSERGRRALRVHLGRGIEAGLAALAEATRRALG